MRIVDVLVAVAVVQILLVREASAYLDPGTGSFIFQTLIAMVVGAGFTLKLYWSRLRSLMSRRSGPTQARSAAEKEAGAGD